MAYTSTPKRANSALTIYKARSAEKDEPCMRQQPLNTFNHFCIKI